MQQMSRGEMKRAVFQILDVTPASWKEKTTETEAAITKEDPRKLLPSCQVSVPKRDIKICTHSNSLIDLF
jgi:hypothetical protein